MPNPVTGSQPGTASKHPEVAGRVGDGDALQRELHVLVALANFVSRREVGFFGAVGGGNDLGGGGVLPVNGRIARVTALEGAVGAVDAVEVVVEGGALLCVAELEERRLLWVGERHGVLEVEGGLAVEAEGASLGLHDDVVEQDDAGALAAELGLEFGEEGVQVGLKKGLGCVLDYTECVQVVVGCQASYGYVVEGSETARSDHGVALIQSHHGVLDFDTLLWVEPIQRASNSAGDWSLSPF